jgi:protein-tyrosine-phosphatase
VEGSVLRGRHTSGGLCRDALRAFDRLCALERTEDGGRTELTPRQRHRRGLLEQRAAAVDWTVPDELGDTIEMLIATADDIEEPSIALLWTDHLPVAVLSCLERRSLARRIAEGDFFLRLA